jgi:hypothetical protein
MKSAVLGTLLFIAFTMIAPSLRSQSATGVAVPDAATALKIAEPAFVKTYGKRQIDYERPLTAKLDHGVWSIYGTLCCPDRNGQRTCEEGRCDGGVAVLKLRQRDGEILSIQHYK